MNFRETFWELIAPILATVIIGIAIVVAAHRWGTNQSPLITEEPTHQAATVDGCEYIRFWHDPHWMHKANCKNH